LQGSDRDIFNRLFPGDTQTEAELHHLINLRANLTMKTPNASGKGILKMERSEDPQQAVGSLITLTLGNLNRRATQVRKLTGPLAAKTLEDVKARKAGELENVMAHPMEMSKMGKKTANSIEDAEHRRVFLNSIGRGIGRFNSNATSDWVSQLHVPHYSDLQSEMSNLFGSSAPTDEEDYTQDNTPVDDEN
jgi:hypothetical protein